MTEIKYQVASIHEAGHVIATLTTGCLLYHCIVGNVKGESKDNSLGTVSRGINTRQHGQRHSAVISISGAMSEYLHVHKNFNLTEFLDMFATKAKYNSDIKNCEGYSWELAALESKRELLRRWENLERLIKKLKQPKNHNRVIGAAELFQMAGCRLLDSRKLPVPKRLVQGRINHYSDAGYYQWQMNRFSRRIMA